MADHSSATAHARAFWQSHLPAPPPDVTPDPSVGPYGSLPAPAQTLSLADLDFGTGSSESASDTEPVALTPEQIAYVKYSEDHQRQFQADLVQIRATLLAEGPAAKRPKPAVVHENAPSIPKTLHRLVGSLADPERYQQTFGAHSDAIKTLESNTDNSFKMALLHQDKPASYYPAVPLGLN